MIYVGSSVDLWRRYQQHLWSAEKASKIYFHRILREFGSDTFDFEVLTRCPRHELLGQERFYIALLGAASVSGFNGTTKPTGGHTRPCSPAARQRLREASSKPSAENLAKRRAKMLGQKRTPEQRARMSAAAKTRFVSEERKAQCRMMAKNPSPENLEKRRQKMLLYRHSAESKAKIGMKSLGRPLSAEARGKISAKAKGRKGAVWSDEARQRMSEAAKLRGRSPEHEAKLALARQRPISAETRAKMSAAAKARPVSEETKARLRVLCVGKKHTAETCAKVSAAKTGKKRALFSPEWRTKIGEATRRRHEAKRLALRGGEAPPHQLNAIFS
jgi:group I intron endonuclease